MASEALLRACRLLSGLRLGDEVIVTLDGRDRLVTVQSTLRRDPGHVGDPHHARVTVGYGPGRWNIAVSAVRIIDGYIGLRRPTTEETP